MSVKRPAEATIGDGDPEGITVRKVLEMPAVRQGAPEILAGKEALDAQVRWVHAGEVPNMAALLKGSELLLTTGMGIAANPALQRKFIADLSERGVVGVVIELGTAMKSIPKVVIEAARKHELPLVALHRPIRFVEVTELVHREIFDRGGALLRYGEELHQRFISLLLSGATVPELLRTLAQIVNNPVFLEHADHGLVYHAPGEHDEETILGAWESIAISGPAALPSIVVEVPEERGWSWGRLVVLEIDSPLQEHHRVAAEQAVGLIAISLLHGREERELASRERGDFLARLLSQPGDTAAIERRAGELGFDVSSEVLLPLAIRLGPRTRPGSAVDGDGWKQISSDLRRDLASRYVTSLLGTREQGWELLLVVGLRDEAERPRIAELVAELVAASSLRARGTVGAPIVCVGAATRSWAEVGPGLATAQAAIAPAIHGPGRLWHDATDPDPNRLLWSLRENQELRDFVELRLGALLSEEEGRERRLRDTLVEYCRHLGRKTDTARALGIERQSLYHRLSRLESVLGVDLTDGETILTLFLALRAEQYLPESATGATSGSPSRA